MADEPIETVAVRLLADARPLLEQTDEAVEQVEESMEEMGSAVEEGLNQALAEGGQMIADFAEKFTLSIEQAMEVLKKTGDLDKFLGAFSEADLLKAGDAIRGQIAEPITEAKAAAEGFGDAINVQVADFLAMLERSDAIDEFLGGFSQAELDSVAASISQNVTDPTQVAAQTLVELAKVAGISFSELVNEAGKVNLAEALFGAGTSSDIIDDFITLGAAIERDLNIPIENATKAIEEFAESVGLSVRDVVEAFGGEGELDDFLSKFSPEELSQMAQNINDGLVRPVIDATAGTIELSAQAEGVAGAVEGWADPLDDAGSAIERTVAPAGAQIDSSIVQPMGDAADATGLLGESVDKTLGQKFPDAVSKAGEEIRSFGQDVENAFSRITIQAQAGTLEQSSSAIKTLMRDLQSAMFGTEESAESLAEKWSELSVGMGLSAENLLNVMQGNFEPIQLIIEDAGEALVNTMAESGISMEQAIVRLDETAKAGNLTAHGLRTLVDTESVLAERTENSAKAMAGLEEVFMRLPAEAREEWLPVMQSLNEMIEKSNILTEDQINFINAWTSEIEFQAEMMEVINPRLNEMVENLKKMGVELNTLQIQKLTDGARAVGQASGDIETATNEIGNYLSGQEQAITKSEKLGTATDILSGFFQTFGGEAGGLASQLIGVATQAGLVLVAFQALKKAIDVIKQASERVIELSSSTGALAAALALQAAATGEARISLADMIGLSDRLALTYSLNSDAIVDAAKSLFLMNQQSKLTNDQMVGLIERGSAMAKLFDKDVGGVLTNLMNFIATGLRSGLDDFGIQLDQQAVKAKAAELGYGRDLKALNEMQMAYVRFALVLDQTEAFEEAAKSIDTLADRMNIVDERMRTSSDTLGNIFAPAVVALKEQWADVVEGFISFIGIVATAMLEVATTVIAAWISMAAVVEFVRQSIEDRTVPTITLMSEVFNEAFSEAKTDLMLAGMQRMTGGLAEMEQGFEDLAGTARDAGDELGDVTDEMAEAFADAAERFDEGMAQIEARFNRAISDIAARFAQRRADAETDLARDLRDIDSDAAKRRIDSIREFQIAEIRMREDHQLDIRQLEERYVLDLQDAVRERDARGVLNLQRRFNLEKKQRIEDYNLNMKRLKENHKDELLEIEAQRLRRRAAKIRQFQEEMMDLAEQERRRREQAQINRDRAEADLLDSIKRRLDLLIKGAEAELEIEVEKLKFLMDALTKAYGANSFYEKMYIRAITIAELAAVRIAAANRKIFQGVPILGGRLLEDQDGTSRQRGGTVMATSPTQVTMGEGRPEIAQITPLSQATGAPAAGFGGGVEGGGGGERHEVQITMDEGLRAEIIDEAMSETAEVVITLNQRNGGGGVRGG